MRRGLVLLLAAVGLVVGTAHADTTRERHQVENDVYNQCTGEWIHIIGTATETHSTHTEDEIDYFNHRSKFHGSGYDETGDFYRITSAGAQYGEVGFGSKGDYMDVTTSGRWNYVSKTDTDWHYNFAERETSPPHEITVVRNKNECSA